MILIQPENFNSFWLCVSLSCSLWTFIGKWMHGTIYHIKNVIETNEWTTVNCFDYGLIPVVLSYSILWCFGEKIRGVWLNWTNHHSYDVCSFQWLNGLSQIKIITLCICNQQQQLLTIIIEITAQVEICCLDVSFYFLTF